MKSTYAIETTLHIGECAGLKVTRVMNDDITCSEIPRALIKYLLTNRKMNRERSIQELKKPNCSGIYFLVNYNSLKIYVKKTTKVLDNLFSEAYEGDKKTWFTHALFLRKDFPTQFSQEELDYLEWYFVDKVVASQLNKKNNQTVGKEPFLNEIVQKNIDKYIKSINILLMESPLNLNSSEIAEESIADEPGYGEFSKTDFSTSFNNRKDFMDLQKLKREQKFEDIVSSVMTHSNYSSKNSFFERMQSIKKNNGVELAPTLENKTPSFMEKLNANRSKSVNLNQEKSFNSVQPQKDNAFLNKIQSPILNSSNNINKSQTNDFSSLINTKKFEPNKLATMQKIDNLFTNNSTKPITTNSNIEFKSVFQSKNTNSFEDIKPISFEDNHTLENKTYSSDQITYKCGRAKGYYQDGFITFLEGSIIKRAMLDPQEQNYKQASVRIRFSEQQEWIEKGYIKAINSNQDFILLQKIHDIPINIATQHVNGEIGIDGKECWFNPTGKNINQIERTV